MFVAGGSALHGDERISLVHARLGAVVEDE
jgi:hypothetical protein